ncbi:thiamine pyrophosphate-binding protein [Pseudooceanicola sp.]|uniref:thiamine pyrophosphate-binding protein n=1 Tax=Pseudooceanicola sp. TaxID=1914328 RepID=UPI00262AFE05|nr:thiamine pyrophosphate-binding protein [Pseudooceanicola sp.]MDF1857194.1 thiamine pyrophosphate-binding protein [Pseudooceanicola sp.]
MSTENTIYRAIARAMVAEGITTHFALLGDGNMHFGTVLAEAPEITTINMRHEHCCVAAAMAWSDTTGELALASVTCGPGLTQLMTGLTQAARSRVPLICFVGEAPIHKDWYAQDIDQAALVTPTGARYVAARSPGRLYAAIQKAFHIARHERLPVVLGVPLDMQKEPAPAGDYTPAPRVSSGAAVVPEAAGLDRLADLLATAKRPVILAGKGVIQSGAAKAVEDLAEASGALLSTTLPAMGLYDHNPYSLGVSGGYAREYATELAAGADLVLAFGASLSTYTLAGGSYYGSARRVQIDIAPLGLYEGVWGADEWLVADAGLTAIGVTERLKGRPVASELRTQDVAARLARDVSDSAPRVDTDTLVDPRTAIDAIDAVLPKDYQLVAGNGHQAFWQASLRGFQGGNCHVYKNFSAIGSGLSFAIGVTAAQNSDRVAFIEGDGSLMMHVQELDTVKRHNLKMLIIVMNDAAYGAEIHKLRAVGLNDSVAIHGFADFAAIARGFGLRGATATNPDEITAAIAEYEAGEEAMVLNIHISDQIASPRMRKQQVEARSA